MAHPLNPSNYHLLAFVFGPFIAHLAICLTLREIIQILGIYGQYKQTLLITGQA